MNVGPRQKRRNEIPAAKKKTSEKEDERCETDVDVAAVRVGRVQAPTIHPSIIFVHADTAAASRAGCWQPRSVDISLNPFEVGILDCISLLVDAQARRKTPLIYIF